MFHITKINCEIWQLEFSEFSKVQLITFRIVTQCTKQIKVAEKNTIFRRLERGVRA